MAWTEEQKKIRSARAAAWAKANPDRRHRTLRLYYLKNKARLKKKAKAYAQAHKQDFAARARRFRQLNPWYDSWQGARQRCLNPKHPAFKHYGGRGIQFHLSKTDVQFLWNRDNAANISMPSLDRTNNESDYTLDNCRFVPLAYNSAKAFHDRRLITQGLRKRKQVGNKSWSNYRERFPTTEQIARTKQATPS